VFARFPLAFAEEIESLWNKLFAWKQIFFVRLFAGEVAGLLEVALLADGGNEVLEHHELFDLLDALVLPLHLLHSLELFFQRNLNSRGVHNCEVVLFAQLAVLSVSPRENRARLGQRQRELL